MYQQYQSLSDEEKTACGLCLNAISNNSDSGQRKPSTSNQRGCLKKHLGSKHLPKLSDNTNKQIKKIIEEIQFDSEEEAYYVALESVRGAHPNDNGFLAHV